MGLARVIVENGIPISVEREGVVLAPDRGWERGVGNAGVEDPRITWIADLGLHVMTYVAYGPLGPRSAIATSPDLREWTRLGPVLFEYDDALDMDLNLFHNKDTVFFPEPVTGPDGVESFAVLHRPMWDLDEVKPGQGIRVPAGRGGQTAEHVDQLRPRRRRRPRHPCSDLLAGHRFLAGPKFAFEEVKVGGGPPRSGSPRAGSCCTTASPASSRVHSTSSRTSTTRPVA